MKLRRGYKLVSYDVVNCFGTIPTEHAIRIIYDDFDKVTQFTSIPRDQFIELLRFCLTQCNYFVFNDELYKQINGLFMGSSLSSILVERVIEKAIDETLEKLDFVPQFWKIYVDDHITAIPYDKIHIVKQHLNQYLEGIIEFTEEIEIDGKINFLDLTLHVDKNGKIRTNWYTKPMASNRLVNYYSAHPRHMIFNIAKSFIRKILTISHREFHKANKKRIFEILEKNNFPVKIIEKLYVQIVNTHLNNTQPPPVTVEQQDRRSKRKSYLFCQIRV